MARVVTMAQQKGGAGKTTVLAQLAAAWSGRGARVTLIDLDPQRSLTRWAELRADPTLTLTESKDWRAGVDIVWATRAVIEMCAREGARMRVLLNRMPSRGGPVAETEAALAEAGGVPLRARLGNRVAFATAFLTGRAAAETAPRSRAAEEVAALVEEIDAELAATA